MYLRRAFLCAVMPMASLAGVALAQQTSAAPTSAQRFEARFRIERFSPSGVLLSDTFLTDAITYNTNVSVGRVDITYQGRVGILPNSSGTANLGVSRLGGAGSSTTGFRMTFTDRFARDQSLNQGRIERGLTGDGTALGGEPNRGLFAPFRGTLPNWTPTANARNSDPSNGVLETTGSGSPQVHSIVGGRTQFFGDGPGGDPSDDADPLPMGSGTGGSVGKATIAGTGLAGDFANYYKLSFFPSQGPQLIAARVVNLQVLGQTARYIFKYNGGGLVSNGASVVLPDVVNFTFYVPAPTSGLVLAVPGILAVRRRGR